MSKQLVMYGRRFACYDQIRAQALLDQHQIPYHFVDISRDAEAAERLVTWVGHLSVPTLVVAGEASLLPLEEPTPLDPKRRIRGQNRGTLITEPSDDQLRHFLQQHDWL